jgi:hypothetical protein
MAAWLLACTGESPQGKGGDLTPGDDTDGPVGPTCSDPTLTALHSAGGTVYVPLLARGAEEAAALGGRPIVVDGESAVTLSLDVSLAGVATARDAAGELLTLPMELTPEALPARITLSFAEPGTATLRATPGEGCAPAALELRSTLPTELAVQPIPTAPGLWHRDTWRQDEAISVALDPAEHPDRVGLSYDIWVVAHKEPAVWLADPTLTDVTDGVEHATLVAGAARDNLVEVWARPRVGGRLTSAWDVVLDFGGDGRLDPGDLIDGLGARPGLWTTANLTDTGRFTPHRERIDDAPFLVQEIWYPEEIGSFTQPAPLVILSHGNGHSYDWYDHLGRHLSSWGYVFMSHANNTVPGVETASNTTLKNTDHFVGNHAGWFGGALAGHVDTHHIAWIGHSRGGEGVVYAYDRLVEGSYTPDSFTAADIALISSIAPTVFLGVANSDPHEVFYHQLLGSADGDVTGGVDCDLCQSLRIANAGLGPVAVTYLHGASHNAFHNGGGWDDGTGPDRLSTDKVHAVQLATYTALLGWRLQGLEGLAGWLKTSPDAVRPAGIPDEAIIASTWRDPPTDDVQILDAFQLNKDAELNDAGGAVQWTVTNLVEALMDDRNLALTWNENDPMNGMTAVHRDGFERGVVFDWTTDSTYITRIPDGLRDWRTWEVLSLRAAQGTRHPETVAHDGPLGFAVELIDGAERTVRVPIDPYGLVSAPYPRDGLGQGRGWQNEMNTVRVPLRAFVANGTGLDLADIRAVRLVFGTETGAVSGRLVLDDLYLGRW